MIQSAKHPGHFLVATAPSEFSVEIQLVKQDDDRFRAEGSFAMLILKLMCAIFTIHNRWSQEPASSFDGKTNGSQTISLLRVCTVHNILLPTETGKL